MGIGQQVSAAREAFGWSQEDLAAKVGVSRSYVSRIEHGARDVSFDVLRKLVAVLGLDPAMALGVDVAPADTTPAT